MFIQRFNTWNVLSRWQLLLFLLTIDFPLHFIVILDKAVPKLRRERFPDFIIHFRDDLLNYNCIFIWNVPKFVIIIFKPLNINL